MSRSHLKPLAITGILAAFFAADVAFAGKHIERRLRPGTGFWNQRESVANRSSRPATQQYRPLQNLMTPIVSRPAANNSRVVGTPRVIYSSPAVVGQPATPPQVVHQTPAVQNGQPVVTGQSVQATKPVVQQNQADKNQKSQSPPVQRIPVSTPADSPK